MPIVPGGVLIVNLPRRCHYQSTVRASSPSPAFYYWLTVEGPTTQALEKRRKSKKSSPILNLLTLCPPSRGEPNQAWCTCSLGYLGALSPEFEASLGIVVIPHLTEPERATALCGFDLLKLVNLSQLD